MTNPFRYSEPVPAYETVKHSIVTMRGCFVGCTFCSITEHEGRIIQSRSEASVLREVRELSRMSGFSGVLTEQGGGWFYKPNLGDGRLGPVETIRDKPSLSDLRRMLTMRLFAAANASASGSASNALTAAS